MPDDIRPQDLDPRHQPASETIRPDRKAPPVVPEGGHRGPHEVGPEAEVRGGPDVPEEE